MRDLTSRQMEILQLIRDQIEATGLRRLVLNTTKNRPQAADFHGEGARTTWLCAGCVPASVADMQSRCD